MKDDMEYKRALANTLLIGSFLFYSLPVVMYWPGRYILLSFIVTLGLGYLFITYRSDLKDIPPQESPRRSFREIGFHLAALCAIFLFTVSKLSLEEQLPRLQAYDSIVFSLVSALLFASFFIVNATALKKELVSSLTGREDKVVASALLALFVLTLGGEALAPEHVEKPSFNSGFIVIQFGIYAAIWFGFRLQAQAEVIGRLKRINWIFLSFIVFIL